MPRYSDPGIAIQLLPRPRRRVQLAHRDDRAPVLVDPGPQPIPLAQQRLVGDLDGRHPRRGVAVECEQTCLGPSVDDRVERRTVAERHQLRPLRPPAGRFPVVVHDDEPLERLPDRRSLVVVERLVERLGSCGDGAGEAAHLAVCSQRQLASGGALDHLVQRVLQRGQRRRLVDDGVHQLGDERPLDGEPGPAAGSTMAASTSEGAMAATVTVVASTTSAKPVTASGRSK